MRVDNEVAKAKNVEVKKISTLKSINKKTLKKDIQEKEHFLKKITEPSKDDFTKKINIPIQDDWIKKIKTNENGLKFFRE